LMDMEQYDELMVQQTVAACLPWKTISFPEHARSQVKGHP
jgi:hypothetical protein